MRLSSITRYGDRELRTLLIHGARAEMRPLDESTPLGRWVGVLQRRRHRNVAAVALAHKNARIAWTLLAHATPYRSGAGSGDDLSEAIARLRTTEYRAARGIALADQR